MNTGIVVAALLIMPLFTAGAARADGIYWTTADESVGAVGGAQLDGSQQDDKLVARTVEAAGVALGGDHVYWATRRGISRASLDGSGLETDFIASPGASSVAVDGSFIYWADEAGISRSDLDGTHVEVDFIPAVAASSVAVDGGHIYWTNRGDGFSGPAGDGLSIGRASVDGSDVEQNFISVPRDDTVDRQGLGGIAVAGGYVYWADNGWDANPREYYFVGSAIGRARLDGSDVDGSLVPRGLGLGGAVDALAADDAHLYWVSAEKAVGRVGLDGSGVEPDFIPGVGEGAGGGIAVRDGHLFWDNFPHATLAHANVDGTGVSPDFIEAIGSYGYGGALATGAGYLYWANSDTGAIERVRLDGSDLDRTFIRDADASGLAVDAHHIYWSASEGRRIARASLDGSAVEDDFIVRPYIHGGAQLAVDSDYIYWASNGLIGRARLDGSRADAGFVGGVADAGSIAVDPNHIYWTSFSGIGRADRDGGHADEDFIPIPATSCCINGLAVDAGHIYWHWLNVGPQGPPGSWISRARLNGAAVEQTFLAPEATLIWGLAVSSPTAADVTPPRIRVKGRPTRRIKTKAPYARLGVRFSADERASFKCRLDRGRYRRCVSPVKVSVKAQVGDWERHRLLIEASDRTGNVGRPARVSFWVTRQR